MSGKAFYSAAAAVAAVAFAGASSAQEYLPPQVQLTPEVKEWVDLSYFLMSGLGTPDHLPQFLGSAGVFRSQDVPSPLAAQRGTPTVHGKTFDQLYYVGNSVGTWLLQTSDGLIMFDAMNNSQDSEDLIEPRMREMGLDPAQIKYIVIMHAHGDHYGGVKYFQDKYNPRVLAGPRDWDSLAAMPATNAQGRPVAPPPRRDISVQDGQSLTLGGTTVRLFLTPGHTMDTVSALIPVTHNGQQHLLAFWGGTGAPSRLEPSGTNQGLISYRDQLVRFARIGLDAGADGLISNHSVVDGTLDKVRLIPSLQPGQRHPFIFGRDGYARWMGSFIAAVNAGMEVKRHSPPPAAR